LRSSGCLRFTKLKDGFVERSMTCGCCCVVTLLSVRSRAHVIDLATIAHHGTFISPTLDTNRHGRRGFGACCRLGLNQIPPVWACRGGVRRRHS
jgi:hypothetical protein